MDYAEQVRPGSKARVFGVVGFLVFWGIAGFVTMSLL